MTDPDTLHYPAHGETQHLSARFDGRHDATLTIKRATDRRIELLLGWAVQGIWGTFKAPPRNGQTWDEAPADGGLRASHAVAPLLLSRVVAERNRWLVVDAPSDIELKRLTGMGKSSVTSAFNQLRQAGVLANSDIKAGRHYRLYFSPHTEQTGDSDVDQQLELELGERAQARLDGFDDDSERAQARLTPSAPGRASGEPARPGALGERAWARSTSDFDRPKRAQARLGVDLAASERASARFGGVGGGGGGFNSSELKTTTTTTTTALPPARAGVPDPNSERVLAVRAALLKAGVGSRRMRQQLAEQPELTAAAVSRIASTVASQGGGGGMLVDACFSELERLRLVAGDRQADAARAEAARQQQLADEQAREGAVEAAYDALEPTRRAEIEQRLLSLVAPEHQSTIDVRQVWFKERVLREAHRG